MEEERRGVAFRLERERSDGGLRGEERKSGAGLGSIFCFAYFGSKFDHVLYLTRKCECMLPKIVSFGSYLNVLSKYIIFAMYNIYFICESHGQL